MPYKTSYGKGAFVRLIFCSQIFVFMAIGLLDHRTLIYRIAAATGNPGIFTLYSILTLSLVGLVDNIVNDYTPATLAWTLEQRHFIYMGMAFCYALLAVFALNIGEELIIPYYLLNIGLLTGGAFYDVKVRYTQLYRERVRS